MLTDGPEQLAHLDAASIDQIEKARRMQMFINQPTGERSLGRMNLTEIQLVEVSPPS